MSRLMAGLDDRNRLVLRILLGVVALLVVASVLVGIRW
jgi:hypothetical protein